MERKERKRGKSWRKIVKITFVGFKITTPSSKSLSLYPFFLLCLRKGCGLIGISQHVHVGHRSRPLK